MIHPSCIKIPEPREQPVLPVHGGARSKDGTAAGLDHARLTVAEVAPDEASRIRTLMDGRHDLGVPFIVDQTIGHAAEDGSGAPSANCAAREHASLLATRHPGRVSRRIAHIANKTGSRSAYSMLPPAMRRKERAFDDRQSEFQGSDCVENVKTVNAGRREGVGCWLWSRDESCTVTLNLRAKRARDAST